MQNEPPTQGVKTSGFFAPDENATQGEPAAASPALQKPPDADATQVSLAAHLGEQGSQAVAQTPWPPRFLATTPPSKLVCVVSITHTRPGPHSSVGLH